MAARMLCRRVPWPRHLAGSRKDSTQAQLLPVKRVDETADERADKGAVPRHEGDALQEPLTLYYNPDTYRSECDAAASLGHAENDEDGCPSALAPSVWQRSIRHGVSRSRDLSSSKNALRDFALGGGSEPPSPSGSPPHGKPIAPNVEVDPRAFHKCRPEYAAMTLDQTAWPRPIEWAEAAPLLHKVSVLKGNMKPPDMTQLFVALSHLHPDRMLLLRDDRHFTMLLRYSAKLLPLFTAPQLMEVLRSFARLQLPWAHPVLRLYEAEVCCRLDHMSLRQSLLAADVWRCIGMQAPKFLRHLYDSVQRNHRHMDVPELVQLLYIIGEGRSCPSDLTQPLEQLLMLHVRQLYPEEVGAVCLAIFKSQTSLSRSAVTHIIDRAHSLVEDMSDLAVVNVMKLLRFSGRHHPAWLGAMAREVPRRAHGMDVVGLMHVALACSKMHFRNDAVLAAIAERVPPLVPHCRSKDACKLLWAFGMLSFLPAQSPNFYASLTEGLRMRRVEFQRYPQHLLTGLLGLVFVSQFPEDLIALALSPEFVSVALESKPLWLKKDLFMLDASVALELPRWTGPRLSDELREEVAEMLRNFAQSTTCQKPEVLEAESALQDLLGGKRFVRKRMILPHTRSIDLEVHLDDDGQPVPVNPASDGDAVSPDGVLSKGPSLLRWGRMSVGATITDELLTRLTAKNTTERLSASAPVEPPSLHRVEPDEGTGRLLTRDLTEGLAGPRRPSTAGGAVKLAIQVSSRNDYCHHSPQLLGLHTMKRRQLRLAGYHVVELSHQTWFPTLREGRREKLEYLRSKIYKSLREFHGLVPKGRK